MTLVFAGNELDLRRHELRRAGAVVHLEPQVFDLLVLLLRNRDRIVSKDEILDTIWDGRVVSEAALSSRIAAARKAIGDSGDSQALIRTFPKRGFRFVADVAELADKALESSTSNSQSAGVASRGRPLAEDDGASSGTRSATLEKIAKPHPYSAGGKPSLAVLPFVNLNRDPDQEYFSYGLTQDIIRLLGRHRWLAVLSRHTVHPAQQEEHEASALWEALGIRYLVKGSVRKSGERVRIVADVVSAAEGTELWSEVYDIDLVDIFEIQEAMAQQICAVIEPELASVEQRLAARKAPGNLDAWDCYQRGFWHLWGFTNPGFNEAETWFSRAVEIEPGLARAHAALSYVCLQKAIYGDAADRPELLRKSLALGKQAVALDERDCLCRCVLGRAHHLLGQVDEAVAELELALDLNPSFAQAYFALGFAMAYSGREDEAIALLERAAELSPRDPHIWTFHHTRAIAHFALGEFKRAEFFARKAARHPTATYYCYATLIAILGSMGQIDEARALVPELSARRPDYTQRSARESFFFCTYEPLLERYLLGLRQVGIPE